MFYSDYIAEPHKVHTCLALFDTHYDECDGSTPIRTVSFNDVVWC